MASINDINNREYSTNTNEAQLIQNNQLEQSQEKDLQRKDLVSNYDLKKITNCKIDEQQELSDLIDSLDESISVYPQSENEYFHNYDYSNFIKKNPLVFSKGNRSLTTQCREDMQQIRQYKSQEIEVVNQGQSSEFKEIVESEDNRKRPDVLSQLCLNGQPQSLTQKFSHKLVLMSNFGKILPKDEDLLMISARSETPPASHRRQQLSFVVQNLDENKLEQNYLKDYNPLDVIQNDQLLGGDRKTKVRIITVKRTSFKNGSVSPSRKRSVVKRIKLGETPVQSDSNIVLASPGKISQKRAQPKASMQYFPAAGFDEQRQTIQNQKFPKSQSCLSNDFQFQVTELKKPEVKDHSALIIKKQNNSVPLKPSSILKRSTFYVKGLAHLRNSQLVEKKRVKFSHQLQIHEYEKEEEEKSDDSIDDESDDENYLLQNNKMIDEQYNTQYNKKAIELLSLVKKPFSKFQIPPDDPVFKYEYNHYFLREKDLRKKQYMELKMCKAFFKKKSKNSIDSRMLRSLQKQFARKKDFKGFTQKEDGTKKQSKKTIVFNLDNTIVKSQYKKHKLNDFDQQIVVNILGTKRIRLYLSFRPFIKELLESLSKDFELILFSSNSKEYTSNLAQLLTLNPSPDKQQSIFHHVLCKDECLYNEEMDQYITDLDILTENRSIQDIIFISDTYTRAFKHLKNIIPVKAFGGNKKDYSLISLSRYLKQFMRVKDVREKIQSDFKTIDI